MWSWQTKQYWLKKRLFLCLYYWVIVLVVVSFISNRIHQWNNTRKNFVDISKHIETLRHLPVVTREAAGLIKLATNKWLYIVLTFANIHRFAFFVRNFVRGAARWTDDSMNMRAPRPLKTESYHDANFVKGTSRGADATAWMHGDGDHWKPWVIMTPTISCHAVTTTLAPWQEGY